MKRRILLYNPPSDFYAMPLGLVSVGSALDPDRYDVRIFDQRIDPGADALLMAAAADARCVGMTVFSGAPIEPALRVSRQLKNRYPELPVVWGGWHPSILPEQCIESGAVDAVVIGQGEATFRELVETIGTPERWSSIAGLCLPGPGGPRRTSRRPLVDMNQFSVPRYDLLDVERYFQRKGARQIDYSSSRGCPYKCTFCADPIIYRNRWTALTAARTLQDLMDLHATYGFDEVSFLDDDLFASLKRIQALVEALVDVRAPFTWTGAARADELCRLPPDFFPRLAQSGCRRVTIGAESGSQKVLDQIRKQYRVGQIVEAARRAAAAGVGVSFGFIAGFPGETSEDFRATLDVLKQVRRISPRLEATLYFYSPYPGTELVTELEARGLKLPDRLEDWSDFSIDTAWLPDRAGLSRRIRNLNFYLRHAYAEEARSWSRRLIQSMARIRCDNDWYGFAWEPFVARLVR